ncbi:Putative Transcriptional Regulator, MarR family [Georgfuchsia toluolica]|uniref:Transcriptional Regulator, MarR family n=1 Tax=Georgfuchsia toluolica TaxID=424218 RepID=A0A916JAD4_9PROT|nr:MarR family transcriptional regulator [Georgfuchsia toluolica]CAG4885278.1 Putative Transcriptional Regulator, MarR family [Georgfuchsia toluolica]
MSKTARRAPFLSVLRELTQCYQAFERYSAAHIQTLKLTPPQFDVIATLGNTQGMTFRELGERTLITKGTLTGVVDRLEAKGIVSRESCPEDGRATIVRLTRQGDKIFDRAFPAHISHLREAFGQVCEQELAVLEQGLSSLRKALSAAADNKKENQ